MTGGGKKKIRRTGDHNWDMERMQFEKEKGNVSSSNDYVNMQQKADDVATAMGVDGQQSATTGGSQKTMNKRKNMTA